MFLSGYCGSPVGMLDAALIKQQKTLLENNINFADDHWPPVDLEAKRLEVEHAVGRKVSDTDLASYLMYPKVFKD